MMVRVLLVLLALIAAERAADACCLGCACTKYKDQHHKIQPVIQQQARTYVHSTKGAVPGLSKITAFLTTGTWTPEPIVYKSHEAQPTPDARVVPPPTIRFATADKADQPSTLPGQMVLVRRVEKHGSAILVEVDGRTFKLATCPKKAGYACLVDPGKLTLRPIPPPGDDRFAKPPQ